MLSIDPFKAICIRLLVVVAQMEKPCSFDKFLLNAPPPRGFNLGLDLRFIVYFHSWELPVQSELANGAEVKAIFRLANPILAYKYSRSNIIYFWPSIKYLPWEGSKRFKGGYISAYKGAFRND